MHTHADHGDEAAALRAFLREHAAVVQAQDAACELVLPLPVPPPLLAVLARFPAYAPAPWPAAFRMHVTRTLHPTLFDGVDAAALEALRGVLDFYALPKAWSEWVAQEAAARAGGNPFATPSALTPVVAAAFAALRYTFDLSKWPTDADVWEAAVRMSKGDVRHDDSVVLQLAIGMRVTDWGFFAPCSVLAVVGDLEGLQWAHRNGGALHAGTCVVAARGGHLAVLQWLTANGCPLEMYASLEAARNGHLEVLQWLRATGYRWSVWTCSEAARGGRLEVLQWLRANGCPWNECTCTEAAQGGHLEVLRWARQAGCPWDKRTCAAAALGGHLTVLQWLRANGCPWSAMTCAHAAWGGHLAVLQWLRAQGCPWDGHTVHNARVFASRDVLEWVIAQGCPEAVSVDEGSVEVGSDEGGDDA